MPPWSSAPATPDGGAPAGLPAEATTRVPLAVAGIGAAVVLVSSWSTIRPPFDAALALVIVIGVVHGLVGWVPGLRIPPRLGPSSVAAYGLVLLLYLLLTPDRLGAGDASVLWTRLGCGLLLATGVHFALQPWSASTAARPRADRARPGWREVAVLALVPGCVGALVLVVHGVPGDETARRDWSGIMDQGRKADRVAYQPVAAGVPSAVHAGHHWSKA